MHTRTHHTFIHIYRRVVPIIKNTRMQDGTALDNAKKGGHEDIAVREGIGYGWGGVR